MDQLAQANTFAEVIVNNANSLVESSANINSVPDMPTISNLVVDFNKSKKKVKGNNYKYVFFLLI